MSRALKQGPTSPGNASLKTLAAALVLAGALSFGIAAGGAAPTKQAKPSTATLTVGMNSDLPNLDVQLGGNALISPLLVNVYESLTKFDDKEQTVPLLATSWKQTNTLTWRFEIRPGVKFQNGEKFTPSAAVYSITRALTPSSENLGFLGQISGATVAGPHQIDVTTKAPDPSVPTELVFVPMVSPAYVLNNQQAFLTQKAIGTGPYLFSNWVPGQYYTFTRNPHYWGAKQLYQTVTFKVIPDSTVRLQALRAGEIQLTQGISSDSVSQAPKVRGNIDNEDCLVRLNTQAGPFADPAVRQAANYALDRVGLIKALYGRFAALPHAQAVTEASFGFDPTLKDYPYDLAKAKALLASSSYKGASIQLIGRQGRWPNDRNLVLATTNMLQQAGFNVQAVIADTATWRAAVFNLPRPDMVFYCTSDDTLTGTKVLDTIFVPTGPQAAYSNPAVTAAVTKAETEFDPAKRAADLHAIWAQIKSDAAFLPLVTIQSIWGMAANVVFTPRHDNLLYVDSVKVKSS